MGNATASTTIVFGDQAISLSMQLDDQMNNNQTSFDSGSNVHFLIFSAVDDIAIKTICSSGAVTPNGTKQVDVAQTVVFGDASTATLDNLPTGSVTWSWMGNDGGVPVFDGRSITLARNTVGVLQCSYTTTARAFILSGVTIPANLDEFDVVVVAEGSLL